MFAWTDCPFVTYVGHQGQFYGQELSNIIYTDSCLHLSRFKTEKNHVIRKVIVLKLTNIDIQVKNSFPPQICDLGHRVTYICNVWTICSCKRILIILTIICYHIIVLHAYFPELWPYLWPPPCTIWGKTAPTVPN